MAITKSALDGMVGRRVRLTVYTPTFGFSLSGSLRRPTDADADYEYILALNDGRHFSFDYEMIRDLVVQGTVLSGIRLEEG